MKNTKCLSIFIMSLFILMIYNSKTAFAKPISNILKGSFTVISSSGNVEEDVNSDYSDINKAIQNAKDGGTVKIKSGEYRIDSIIDKNVTIDSSDGGYVDIITNAEIPKDIKIKVSDKVTINQQGLPPTKLIAGIMVTGPGGATQLSENDINVTVKQGETVNIKLRQEIINRLGFHDLNVMLRINNGEKLKIFKNVNAVKSQVNMQENGICNLGKMPEISNEMILSITFDAAGEYNIELWTDDNR